MDAGMGYVVALSVTVTVAVWMAVDVTLRSPRRKRTLPITLTALAIAAWAAGQTALLDATTPGERLLARKLLYLGTVVLPAAWFWTGAVASHAAWLRRRRWLGIAVSLPGIFFYSCLYWEDTGLYVHPTMPAPPTMGPLYYLHLAWAWMLVVAGVGYLLRAAVRIGKADRLRTAGIVLASAIPLLTNAWHVVSNPSPFDPTPVMLAVSVLLIRFSVLESGMAGFIPVARRDVIEQLQDGVAVLDLDGRVVDANPAARALLGRAAGADSTREAMGAAAAGCADRDLELCEFPVSGPLGKVGSCILVRDRTEARRAERRLLHAGKLEALGVLTAGIAHEVNNPLAFVRANLCELQRITKTLADRADATAAEPRHLRETAREADEILLDTLDGVDRMVELVRDLRIFAHAEGAGAEPGPVDLRAAAEKARSLASAGPGRRAVSIESEPDLPPAYAREGEVVQILVNLVVNALQAGGDAAGGVEVRVARAGEDLEVTVRDHGPGFPPEILGRVFDPFFTTKDPGVGTGLGLSLSLDLARRAGGSLEAANHPDGGARMRLRLPARTPASGAA
jgi:signal transduction histidine kinase